MSSSDRETGLIDLTTVRVAALPLSRLEGPMSGLLTTTRVRLNRAALCQRINPLKVECCGFVFCSLPERVLRASAAERSESRRASGVIALTTVALIVLWRLHPHSFL